MHDYIVYIYNGIIEYNYITHKFDFTAEHACNSSFNIRKDRAHNYIKMKSTV